MIIAIIILTVCLLFTILTTIYLYNKLKLTKIELSLLAKYCHKKDWNSKDRIEAIDLIIRNTYNVLPDDMVDVRKIKFKDIIK